ncbi:hypothetical protein [Mycolicibacterium goodii]|uniref:Uncharacterized protein n=1 Tax=Mycolicibacterium goodii TaxID=134601 RepID=A0A0K0X1H5_MYCGD|nr:hypothetical protein AFA91_04515 [Mycolicibacterium goodii]
MTEVRRDPAALLRGAAVGLITPALAFAAHGAGGGGLLGGAVLVQLTVLALTLGAVAATTGAANRACVLWALLGTGQLLAHLLLATAGHHDGVSATRPGAVMLLAHAVAVSVGALLIAGGARLCAVMSRAVSVPAAPVHVLPEPTTPPVVVEADRPSLAVQFLAASMSHRGPPVGVRA